MLLAMGRWEAKVKFEEFREVACERALWFVNTVPLWNSEEERSLVRLTAIDDDRLDIQTATWPNSMRIAITRRRDAEDIDDLKNCGRIAGSSRSL